jgi:hypothetical protein
MRYRYVITASVAFHVSLEFFAAARDFRFKNPRT